MKNPFKKEAVQYKAKEEKLTPYERAHKEWDERIGSARAQAENWRLIAILSSAAAILLLILSIIIMSVRTTKVFVAQVEKGGRVVNVAPLTVPYNPTQAQKEYFISNFIQMIRGVPLDPVVAKKNWVSAYNFLTQASAKKLNELLQKDNPLSLLGKKTVTVDIGDINPISDNTFNLDWTESTVDVNGEDEGQKSFSGTFTITIKQPTTQQQILANPLGIYIIDFNISPRE